jgi:A/G-specific adenine glycosylase
VMLQQTSVARVLPRWESFLRRWPTPAACAAEPLDEVLREWSGLGYPRRAAALHRCAQAVAQSGWPRDEAALRALPGIGPYTARALLAFAFDADVPPPRDVNLGRVAARAALGVEPHEASPKQLDAVLSASRPPQVSPREHAFALFDLGATVCRARQADCAACPLHHCASRARLAGHAAPAGGPRRQAPYAGSMRQLRGAVLRALLDADAPATWAQLHARIATTPAAATPGAVEQAVAGLRRDGLLGRDWPDR